MKKGLLLLIILAGVLFFSYGWLHWLWDSSPHPLLLDDIEHNFDGDVIIVGAGAAGLAASFLLDSYGIDHTVLEATGDYGGRVKKDSSLADKPLDIGAEWIHHHDSILGDLVGHTGPLSGHETMPYAIDDVYRHDGHDASSLTKISSIFLSLTQWVYPESKFVDSTWYDYLTAQFASTVEDHIVYHSPVTLIDRTDARIRVVAGGKNYRADRVILTVPIGVLQHRKIGFVPDLPAWKYEAIDSVTFLRGFKLFMKFSESFYPDALFVDVDPGEKTLYDALYGKDSDDHVLGLLVVGDEAERYYRLGGEAAIVAAVLDELDDLFGDQANQYYLGSYVLQDWGRHKYTLGTWTVDDDETYVDDLVAPLDDKVFFAGEAYNLFGQRSTVQGAIVSAYTAVYDMLGVVYR